MPTASEIATEAPGSFKLVARAAQPRFYISRHDGAPSVRLRCS